MFCPFCNHKDSRVLDSRATAPAVRRRRLCEHCGKRFTTYERIEEVQLLVVKSSGDREPYQREKLSAGLKRACAKTPTTAQQIDDLVDSIEGELSSVREIGSNKLGEMALSRLCTLNQVAYVRFASVYRQFRSIQDFIKELDELL
jgi:transcriptional repressor NrdR